MKIDDNVLRDFVIVIDTRESEAYKFKDHNVVFKKLDIGDYSVKGFEAAVTIERKTHGDFLGSITHRRGNFEAEMKRMQGYKIKAVVIEASHDQLVSGHYPYAKVNLDSVLGTMVAIVVDYGIPVVAAQNRQQAEEFTLRMLKRAFMVMRGLR